MSAQAQQGQPAKGGFWKKVNSWWGGDDGDSPSSSGGSATAVRSASGPSSDAGLEWPADRVRVLEGLFGPGMIAPWCDDIQADLVGNLKVTDETRVVVLGGGFGGPADYLQKQTGAAVFAFDDRVEVADLARDWLAAENSQVKHDRRDFFDTGLKPGFADAIVGFGGFSHMRDRRRLFGHLLQILRPNGRIVFTDFFITGRDPECPEVAIWSALEDRPRHLTSQEDLSAAVYDIGFDTPDFRDVTEAYRTGIRSAFGHSVNVLKDAGADAPRLQAALVAELERWNRRLALIESGEARFYQVTIEYFGKGAIV